MRTAKERAIASHVDWIGICMITIMVIVMVIFHTIDSTIGNIIFRLIACMLLLFIGMAIKERRYADGFDEGYICGRQLVDTEIKTATRHLRQENKDLQKTIFEYEAVIRELEKNAGCYEGEEP